MLEIAELVGCMGVIAVIAVWYFQNVEPGADGERGWLAIRSNSAVRHGRRRYTVRERAGAPRAKTEARKRFHRLSDDEKLQRRYRRQDEVRYRVRDRKTFTVKKKRG